MLAVTKSQHSQAVRCHGLKDNVAALPSPSGMRKISIPQLKHVIEPVPGKMASVAIYNYLAEKYKGKLEKAAAEEALSLYAEAVEDARKNPGAHPNIDLLLDLLSQESTSYDLVVERGS
jgi:hypothetical protein